MCCCGVILYISHVSDVDVLQHMVKVQVVEFTWIVYCWEALREGFASAQDKNILSMPLKVVVAPSVPGTLIRFFCQCMLRPQGGAVDAGVCFGV